jgi:hypothetical protein
LVGTQVEEWRSILRESVLMEAKTSCLLNVWQWKADGVEIVPLVELVKCEYTLRIYSKCTYVVGYK